MQTSRLVLLFLLLANAQWTLAQDRCLVDFRLENSWTEGYQARVVVNHAGQQPLEGWSLSWEFSDGESIGNAWNADLSQQQNKVVAKAGRDHWNGKVAANGAVTIGMVVKHTGSFSEPAKFHFNGLLCAKLPSAESPIKKLAVENTKPTYAPAAKVEVTPTEQLLYQAQVKSNPFTGAKGYLNPDYRHKVLRQAQSANGFLRHKMEKVAEYPTAIWLDRISAIYGDFATMGLEQHLNTALKQQKDQPLTVTLVLYNLPNRDCSANASNGELEVNNEGLSRYRTDFIDPIRTILSKPQFQSLRIVTIIEPDSLPNLVTNRDNLRCQEAEMAYVNGIQYAINQLYSLENVYLYLDIAHAGWLGWPDKFESAVRLYTRVIEHTDSGLSSIRGFISNTSGYTPLKEPVLKDANITPSNLNQPVRAAEFYGWNPYLGEHDYVVALRKAFVGAGFPDSIGMLIDTSRNGWGGSERVTQLPTNYDSIDQFVAISKIDRRPHRGNWCNQQHAGIGERPTANPVAGIDAFVWVKPPGESDGVSDAVNANPNEPSKKFDSMCSPNARSHNDNRFSTSALPGAPHAGVWFPQQFVMLVNNAHPPL